MLCDWLELVLRHSFENRSKISLVTKVSTHMVVGVLTTLSSFLIFLQNFLTLFLKGENSVRIIFFLYLLF